MQHASYFDVAGVDTEIGSGVAGSNVIIIVSGDNSEAPIENQTIAQIGQRMLPMIDRVGTPWLRLASPCLYPSLFATTW